MGSKIGAAVFSLIGLAFLGLAATAPASALTTPRAPSIGWLSELPKAQAVAPVPSEAAQAALPQPKEPPPAAVALTPPQATADAVPAGVQPAEPQPPATAEPALKPVSLVEPKPAVQKVAEPSKVVPASSDGAAAEPRPAALVEPKPAALPRPKPAIEPKAAVVAKRAEPAEPAGIGTLSVTSSPAGAEVFLDGTNIGQTPIELDIPNGSHRIKLVNPASGEEKTQVVQVRKGRVNQVEVSF